MVWRAVGVVVSLGIIAWLLHSVFSSNNKVNEAIDKNPVVIEQKKALKAAGVDADDKKALRKNLDDAAKRLEAYQKQADDLPKDPP